MLSVKLEGSPWTKDAFYAPSEPEATRRHVEELTRHVWAGEYDHSDLPKDVLTILDIGAGWGAFAVWARAKWPQAHQIAYEPHNAAADFYEMNAPWGSLYRRAVTTEPNPKLGVDQYWGSAQTWHRTVGQPVRGESPLVLQGVDLLKIDAEAVEAEILANYMFPGRVRALLYEWHSPELRDECRRILADRFEGMRRVKEPKAGDTYGAEIWLR